MSNISIGATQERLNAFWQFVYERRMVAVRRRAAVPQPWTDDPILQHYRFTNVYRAADRVSQYLIRTVIYNPTASEYPAEEVFRTILFRIFNKPSTYILLIRDIGETPSLARWDHDRYVRVLDTLAADYKLWSNAYMMTGLRGEPKHRTFMRILDQMVTHGLCQAVTHPHAGPEQVYDTFHAYPLISDFLAMQFTTDLGYCRFSNWHENDFLVPGHGARRGAYKLAGYNTRAEGVIDYLTDEQLDAWDRRGLNFPRLGGKRLLSKMDIQNCLCEFDKYCRVAHPEWKTPLDRSANPLPKQLYHRDAAPLDLEYYPPKWLLRG